MSPEPTPFGVLMAIVPQHIHTSIKFSCFFCSTTNNNLPPRTLRLVASPSSFVRSQEGVSAHDTELTSVLLAFPVLPSLFLNVSSHSPGSPISSRLPRQGLPCHRDKPGPQGGSSSTLATYQSVFPTKTSLPGENYGSRHYKIKFISA